MRTYARRARRSSAKNQVLNRELDFLPSTSDRDDVRDIARRFGPHKRRSPLVQATLEILDFIFEYSAPFVDMIVGAEYRVEKALYPRKLAALVG